MPIRGVDQCLCSPRGAGINEDEGPERAVKCAKRPPDLPCCPCECHSGEKHAPDPIEGYSTVMVRGGRPKKPSKKEGSHPEFPFHE